MENQGYQDVIGTAATPYITRLAHENGLATQYFAVGHPSLGQYLALTAGAEYGNPQGCDPTACPVDAANLADRVERSGRSWRAYMESMGSPCRLTSGDGYDVHHNPWIYLNDIRTHGQRCAAHVLDLSRLAPDLASMATTPNLLWITPNDCHDMHSCSPTSGDAWLKKEVSMILGSPAFTQQNSLLVVVWDEDDFTPVNHVAAILAAPKAIRPGTISTQRYTHYSLLRTIETAWGLEPLTENDAGARPISDLYG
jgi:acid phosphatase